MANYPLAFAELLAGAVLLDKGVQAFKGGLANTSANAATGGGGTATVTGSTSPPTAADTNQPSTGPISTELMLAAATALEGAPYTWGGGHSGWSPLATLKGAGVDCSGFVSAVLHAGGFLSSPVTTVTLPDASGIQAGAGTDVTIWDRPQPGSEGHVIIEILGRWFESGGNTAYNPSGGVSEISVAQAMGELAGGGFDPFHPAGL